MPREAAVVTSERIARLMLLAVTLFGFAALHTIGHAAMTRSDQHTIGLSTVQAGLGHVAALIPGDDDCNTDGCTHPAIMSAGTSDSRQRGDVCVAILSVIAIGVLLAARLLLTVLGRASVFARGWPTRHGRIPRPPAYGLAVTGLAVIRV